MTRGIISFTVNYIFFSFSFYSLKSVTPGSYSRIHDRKPMSNRPQSWQPSGTSGGYKDPVLRQLDMVTPKYSLPPAERLSAAALDTRYTHVPISSMRPPTTTKSLSGAKSMSSLEHHRSVQPYNNMLPHSTSGTVSSSRLVNSGIHPSSSWHSSSALSVMSVGNINNGTICNGFSVAPEQSGIQHYGSESKINVPTHRKTLYPYTGSGGNLQTRNSYNQQYSNINARTNNIDNNKPLTHSSPNYENMDDISEHEQYKHHPSHAPPPPVRDASSSHFIKKTNYHSKSSSCPAESDEQLKMKHSTKKTGERVKTWSSSNTKNCEFPVKKSNNVLIRFGESEEDDVLSKPDVIHKIMESSHTHHFRADFLENPICPRGSGNVEGPYDDAKLKSAYNMERGIKYNMKDRDGRTPDSKDYMVPSPPERDSNIRLEEMLQNAKDRLDTTNSSLNTPSESSSGHSPIPQSLVERNQYCPELSCDTAMYTMATNAQHSSYTYTPYYNTGTQIQDTARRQHDGKPHIPEIQPPEEVLYKNVEVQVDMDIVTITPAPTPISTLDRRKILKQEMGTQADSVSWSKRSTSPGTISDAEYKRIHEQASNDESSIMRQLSREFYNQQNLKQQTFSFNTKVPSSQNRRSLPDTKPHVGDRDSSCDKSVGQSNLNKNSHIYDSHVNANTYSNVKTDLNGRYNEKINQDHYELIHRQYAPSSNNVPTSNNASIGSAYNKESIKMAYGIYEDVTNANIKSARRPPDNLLQSSVRDSQTSDTPETVLSSPISPNRLENYTVYSTEAESVQTGNNPFRITSEQIKTNKAHPLEQANRRSTDIQTLANVSDEEVLQISHSRSSGKPDVNLQKKQHSARLRRSDPSVPSYPPPCKSDPKHRYASDPSYPFGGEVSNPYEYDHLRMSEGQFDKRLSTISTTDSGILSVRSSSSGSIDQSGIAYDLKRTHQESKKRMSSSSIDSSLGSGCTTPRSDKNSVGAYFLSPSPNQCHQPNLSTNKSGSSPRDIQAPLNNHQPITSTNRTKESIKNIITNPLGLFHRKGKSVPSALDNLAEVQIISSNGAVEKSSNSLRDKHPRTFSAGTDVQVDNIFKRMCTSMYFLKNINIIN